MSTTVDILIKKVKELTEIVNSIQLNSKSINDLDIINGEEIYVAASNGTHTGRIKVQEASNTIPITPSFAWRNINLIPSSSFFLNDEFNSYNFISSSNSWGGVNPNIKGFNGDSPSDGLIGYLRNGGQEPIVLVHNSPNSQSLSIPFFLSNEANYLIAPNELLSFKYSKSRNRCELSVYNNSLAPSEPFFEVFTLTDEQINQGDNVTLILKNKPLRGDFVNVFCNGAFINPSGISIVDNIIVMSKTKVDYNFKPGMKLTINYKY